MTAVRGRLGKAERDPVFERYRKAFLFAGPNEGRTTAYPRVAVYTGSGASHSWIWFADLMERIGLYDITFIVESDMSSGGLDGFDFLLVGGGDTYAMAESLGGDGARAILRFVGDGGLYLGSCAGAYLVLTGVDLEPFTPFRLVTGEMRNVMPDPPKPRCLDHKYLARYGEEWVFHPVYGEVEVGPGDAAAGFPCFDAGATIRAPLFGGPIMEGAHKDEVLARFSGLSDRAAFLWPRGDVLRLVDGRAAAVVSSIGEGTVVVSGPHLEHPLFPGANALAAEVLLRHCARKGELGGGRHTPGRGGDKPVGGEEAESLAREIRRQVSNARIVAFGLEKMPVTWRIGLKVWEPEKVRMFLDYAWYRLPFVAKRAALVSPGERLAHLAGGYGEVTQMARSVKARIESGEDSQAEAELLLGTLKELTAAFLSVYFKLRLQERTGLPEKPRTS
ncbi:MAG: hypothetical protein KKB90_09905 [Actinobacteria bacterium]|nr:hypothetical protein [Actinomycetota bacterium]MCG2819754.1 BPL-N domain-containing protein [Actinomycetes bacterium]MBU4219258.1 hypothetical protein [Actinomycetota bacterium]MBU4359542.1 hypothetical protein [Actinomycetota bacterium]MBU4390832.1 hypothetical protein [Actinomycetota bacterium]